MEPVRYAVVGAGWISQEAFMPAVPQTGNSRITAIITGDRDKAERLAAFHGVENVFGYEAYDEALNSGLFDAVYIALPNSMHADYAIRAARAGVHALVEKPLAVSVEECEAMISAAEAAGTLLMTAYRLHCEPATVEAIRLIRSGAIGTPRYFTSAFSAMMAPDNHRLRASNWGGPLQDLGVYSLNAARHVFGAEPVEVSAMKGQGDDPRFAEVEETLSASMRFPGGGIGSFTCSFGATDFDLWRVVGTSGVLEVSPAFRFDVAPRIVLTRDGEREEISFPDIDHFGAQTAYFSDCIRSGEAPRPDGQEGLADVRALLAIEAAAATGKPQALPDMAAPRSPVPEMVRMVDRTEHRLVF